MREQAQARALAREHSRVPAELVLAARWPLPAAVGCAASERPALRRSVAPGMDEISLVGDALKQLDELFLLVVVGEFNSGKSSIVNALLGGRFLAEGILPTTNEISILKFGCAHRLGW